MITVTIHHHSRQAVRLTPDQPSQLQIHSSLTPQRIVGFVVGGFAIMMVLGVVLQPASIALEEEMRELYPRLFEMFPPRPESGA